MRHDQGFLEYDEALEAPPDETGGKGRTTALCFRAGLPVPDGVILPRSLCSTMGTVGLPDQLFNAITARMGSTDVLVVRSSAPKEDSRRCSWAGQFTTTFCTNDPAAIRQACHAGWSSAAAAGAAAYGKSVGEERDTGSGGMALLIQRMVPAAAAGVCFTPDPSDESGSHLINAVHGLGSALTDDEVGADHYEVNLKDGQISRTVEGQQVHWRSPADPWSPTDLPAELAEKQVLDPAQAMAVADLAQKAAAVLGCRTDLEWAIEGTALCLLQARPVTAAAGRSEYTSWTRDNAADVIPGAVTPLTWSFVGPAVNRGFDHTLRRLRPGLPAAPLFSLIDGRAYFNMTAYTGLAGRVGGIPGLLSIGTGYLRLLFRHRMEAASAETRFQERLDSADRGRPAETLASLQRLFQRYMLIHVRTTVLMDLGLLLLKSVLRRKHGEEETGRLTARLLGTTGQLASCASARALSRMAEVISGDPVLSRRVQEAPAKAVAQILAESDPTVSGPWRDFLRRHGHSALEEFELLVPRWSEDPTFVGRSLQAGLEGMGQPTGIPSSRPTDRPERLVPRVVRLPVRMLAGHLRRCSLLRESFKQMLVKIMAAARRQALARAAELAVKPTELIFFLTMEEAQVTDDPVPRGLLARRAGQRRQDRQEAAGIAPWAEIREYSDGRMARFPRPVRSGQTIEGLPVSSGRYAGTARVILDPAQAAGFSKGDVLVARATNPGWAPLIALAGAVATDMGNYLSHGAIISRELGIPAVGNLHDATSRIRDGQQVEVDGDQGLVRLPPEKQ